MACCVLPFGMMATTWAGLGPAIAVLALVSACTAPFNAIARPTCAAPVAYSSLGLWAC